MGRLLYDLKAIDQRTIDKYKKEAESIGKGSFAFAWVLDQGSEERARGVTIDIAQNTFSTSTTNFTILDAPGHRDFVPNMIAGASQADFAVLVIDASTGNFESGLRGQTKEHALLVRSIGVSQLIVAVNKMDSANWSQPRFAEIQTQMSTFLTAAGFNPKNVTFVPCSGLDGGNILNPTKESAGSWYTGPTLVAALESNETVHAFAVEKPLRMSVGDVFRGGITNPLSISGRIEAGNLQIGDNILIQPSGETATIKGIDLDDSNDESTDSSTYGLDLASAAPQYAVAGNNVTLHLVPTGSNSSKTTTDESDIRAGDIVCSPANSPIQNVTKFTTKLVAFEHLTPMLVDVHRGRLHKSGRIVKMIETLDKSTGQTLKKKPRVVQPQSWVRVEVDFVSGDGGSNAGGEEVGIGNKVPLEVGNRIVLRAGGITVAAGVVEG
jgi:elongation factor 1 alpha-like protein